MHSAAACPFHFEASAATLPEIDFFDARFKADPHAAYRVLRDEAPVHRIVARDGREIWLVTRHADVQRGLKDVRLVKNRLSFFDAAEAAARPSLPPLMRYLSAHMLSQDPPHHTRLRRRVMQAFSPRLIEGSRPRIQAIADGLLDRVGRRGRIELIEDYAFPLPITVIAELLGVPVEDRTRFRHWSSVLVTHSGVVDEATLAVVLPVLADLADYLRRLFELRRREPRDDLTSRLVNDAEPGDALSEDELISMLMLLIVAGHETTTHLIGNGLLALLRHPDQYAWLLDSLDQRLPQAVEELLRYDGPVETSTLRYAREDMRIAGTRIARGDIVMLVLSSANRDETHHGEAARLDIRRPPGAHLAFGHGIHFCLGASLARLEGEIAIGSLMRRLPGLRLAEPQRALRWQIGPLMRGLERLPLRFDPGAP